ncbi:MAG TPA: RlpA-like double-psi beta-barrel domain-containing protein [Candidatus Limnocylindrales bacterium]|nr:RlpA-like double-psi beta-barrel domain-containing protein [Candidatus Limnocylindrales bacterium]
MRTRIVVVFAALMAASALVAVPAPAGSQPPSPDRSLDPAQLSAVSIGLSEAPGPAMTTPQADIAQGSAGTVEPGSAFLEPAISAREPGRPDVAVPAPAKGAIEKNYWRFDPDISWYGPGFYGNRTACGLRLTRELVGVAHKTLPCGTKVQFRYNGKVVTAPVIDRGPYAPGRTWDMSAGLCTLLGHCFTGTIEWRFAP